jgi:hypothetical protein
MKPADWLDERMHLGEVPASRRDEARERAESDAGAARQRELAASDADILRRLPPERMAERIRQRSHRPARGIRMRTTWIPLALAACVLALGLFLAPVPSPLAPPAPVALGTPPSTDSVRPESTTTPSPARNGWKEPEERLAFDPRPAETGVRVRGGEGLELVAVSPDGATFAADSGVVGGTVLRVKAPSRAHAAVWSFDETGTLVRHWPLSGDSAAALPAGPLPRDWETEASSGWERFVLVWSETPFALAEAHLKGLVASGGSRTRAVSLPAPLHATATGVARRAP